MIYKKFGVKAMDDKGVITAVIATLNAVDKDNDVTLAGAFGEQAVVVLPTHDWMSVPIGKGSTREAGNDVLADIKLNLDIPTAKEWYSALKFDFEQGSPLQEWSYGFDIEKWSRGKFGDKDDVRFLEKLKVHEVSPVLVGAGVNTRTVAVKECQPLAEAHALIEQVCEQTRVLLDRHEAVASMRAKEGRVLSLANRERLSRLRALLSEIDVDLGKLLTETEVNSGMISVEDIGKMAAHFELIKFNLRGQQNEQGTDRET